MDRHELLTRFQLQQPARPTASPSAGSVRRRC